MRNTVVVGVLVIGLSAAVPAPAQVRLAPVVGVTLLEQKDTSLTHGALRDEVTSGRSLLAGGAVDLRFTDHDSLAFELVYGPYHNDVDRYCIVSITADQACEPMTGLSVSHVLLYGMHYTHAFGQGGWRPYAGGGFGVKRVSFSEDYLETKALPAISAAAGVESTSRTPVRVELRMLFMTGHPFLYDKNQIELQARLSVLLGRRR